MPFAFGLLETAPNRIPAVHLRLERRSLLAAALHWCVDGAGCRGPAPVPVRRRSVGFHVGEITEIVDLLECRLRVRGERYRLPSGKARWRADDGAMNETLDRALRWCTWCGDAAPLALQVRTTPPTVVDRRDAAEFVRAALLNTAEVGAATLSASTRERFRAVAFGRWSGRVTLIEGGATIAAGGWHDALRDLKETMSEASSCAGWLHWR